VVADAVGVVAARVGSAWMALAMRSSVKAGTARSAGSASTAMVCIVPLPTNGLETHVLEIAKELGSHGESAQSPAVVAYVLVIGRLLQLPKLVGDNVQTLRRSHVTRMLAQPIVLVIGVLGVHAQKPAVEAPA